MQNTSTASKRLALVTGANKGIGFEISRALAQRGITVLMGARNVQRGETACSRLQAEGLDIHFRLLDVADAVSIEAAVNEISNRFGRWDVLINNAGIMLDGGAAAPELDVDTIQETMRTNFYGPLLLCQGSIALMRKNAYGRIVNISSTLGLCPKWLIRNPAMPGSARRPTGFPKMPSTASPPCLPAGSGVKISW